MLDTLPLDDWLPLAFAALMGVSILIYVVLDGFDLGVGILSIDALPDERDVMIGSIGPFWDANETWLVLAVGLLLVAFPVAHGEILTALYLPTTLMLMGLILRGVAFEFRAKAPVERKRAWDLAFFAGSLLAALTQGYMLGVYVIGLDQSLSGILFGMLTAVCLAAGYAFIGSAWLIAKTEGGLQQQAATWARRLIWPLALGMVSISVASPLASPEIFDKWFRLPEMLLLAPIPLVTAGLFVLLVYLVREMPMGGDRLAWAPFAITSAIFVLGFVGLAYSFFPYVVPSQITIWEAASSRDALMIILVGALITLPVILGYTIFAYRVFGGKATALRYE
ncbi:cytochrome d ubiquinol oxidase subunit II [Halovulum dunhuangense]|uniref:Cytochrome d ubiquinol oxidase subunit II n=1 Tax=Halovulum dunhuangense TaxID=1505036 RepID=A0A849KS08_9RHOB|nr:cytochrome d ubiquinol oxidase subunit II [Halovulum dunhuangense]NNU79659.1 cytochrome d ubiquinol oxidase subunit II [Halovulum dunhuangense]